MYFISTHLYYSDTNLLYLIMQIDENTPISVCLDCMFWLKIYVCIWKSGTHCYN